jgi:hypothetical protein
MWLPESSSTVAIGSDFVTQAGDSESSLILHEYRSGVEEGSKLQVVFRLGSGGFRQGDGQQMEGDGMGAMKRRHSEDKRLEIERWSKSMGRSNWYQGHRRT